MIYSIIWKNKKKNSPQNKVLYKEIFVSDSFEKITYLLSIPQLIKKSIGGFATKERI